MLTRVISALIAIGLFIAVSVFLKTPGLIMICGLVSILATIEFSRLVFHRLDAPRHIGWSFIFMNCFTTFATAASANIHPVVIALITVLFIAQAVISIRGADELPVVSQVIASGALGLMYCGLFAGLVIRLLLLDNGALWLYGLMAIVFSGDTFAYLAGRFFGRHKLLEPVSPKKTIEGSIGGLFGSLIAGAILGVFFLADHPLWAVLLTSVVTGAFAQIGDLFESLLKRVAEVKDSGRIMPGHGGVLDRIDGLLFAAPVYYVLITRLI